MSLQALIEKMRKITFDADEQDILNLCEAAVILKYALAEECYCTGETDYSSPPKPIYCDACEALQRADQICEVKK